MQRGENNTSWRSPIDMQTIFDLMTSIDAEDEKETTLEEFQRTYIPPISYNDFILKDMWWIID